MTSSSSPFEFWKPSSCVTGLPREGKATDIQVVGAELYLLPVQTRVPLKFGAEVLTEVTCARVRMVVVGRDGRPAEGWGETPLSAQWAWPGHHKLADREMAMRRFCELLTQAWSLNTEFGHPLEIGDTFLRITLPALLGRTNRLATAEMQMPYLAALVCCSAFDIALHDAYGQKLELPVYETYGPAFMSRDLSTYLSPAEGAAVTFANRYPSDYLLKRSKRSLPAWHLVGGLDPLRDADQSPVGDGVPENLVDWIDTDGLMCLKIKLRGTDQQWDYQRLLDIGQIAREKNVAALTADFNCTVMDVDYVTRILDRLAAEHPAIYDLILYVEQPFPADLDAYPIEVTQLAQRKPLLMDESAHDWQCVRRGRELGWSGVALKTCKTQTGALLSLCWAEAHGMHLMVQDLTNPMLAQIPHVLLAAHANTLMGVESNAMQFYPAASRPEAAVHPGLYRRSHGKLDLSTLRGPGFGYRLDEMARKLPTPTAIAMA